MVKFLRNLLIVTFVTFIFHKASVYVWTDFVPSGLEKYFSCKTSGADIRFIRIVSFILWSLGLFYGLAWDLKKLARAWQRRPFVMVFSVFVCFVFVSMLSYMWSTSDFIYMYAKCKDRGWVGRLHQKDQSLGFKMRKGQSGHETFKTNAINPVRINESGFRVPAGSPDNVEMKRPLLMFFGCSWTFGMACLAEDTYPSIVAKELNGTCINAAVCSYGLTQMLLSARRLVPKFRPDFVVAQHSGWLMDRAVSQYAPTYFGKVPVPYFYQKKDGSLGIAPPLYPTAVFDFNLDEFKNTKAGPADFARFMFKVGIPLGAYEFLNETLVKLRTVFGLVKRPCGDFTKVEKFAYGEFYRLCRDNNAVLVIAALDDYGNGAQNNLVYPDHYVFAHCYKGVVDPVKDDPGRYEKEYCHWGLVDGKECIIDFHPNAKAHGLFARDIVEAIKGYSQRENMKS